MCGVCRTDLHLTEGDLPPHRPDTIPGHEVVGRVVALGSGCDPLRHRRPRRHRVAALDVRRVSILRERSREPLPVALVHGLGRRRRIRRARDVPRGLRLRDPRRVHRHAGRTAALCRHHRVSRVAQDGPSAGRPVGDLRVRWFGPPRGASGPVRGCHGARPDPLEASTAVGHRAGGNICRRRVRRAPEPLDAAILFAPAGALVPVALRALDRGGVLAVAGIHLSDIPTLVYATDLFEERELRSVTANTRRDGEEFLALAARIPLRPTVTEYPLERAHEALSDLAHDRLIGAAVLDLGT